MILILGYYFPDNKKIYLALKSIYGIGISLSLKILKKLDINPFLKVENLSDLQIFSLTNLLQKNEYDIEGILKKKIRDNIEHLIAINCYRGKRHINGLSVRGQRTRTNSQNCRKNKYIKY
jgi:small subunit ribosomal protein S13